nr:MAG: ORF4 [Torque teno polar bear virus 18]
MNPPPSTHKYSVGPRGVNLIIHHHNRGGAYKLYKQVYFRMAEFLRAGTVRN